MCGLRRGAAKIDDGNRTFGDVSDICTFGTFVEIRSAIRACAKTLGIGDIESLTIRTKRHARRKPAGGNVAQHLAVSRIDQDRKSTRLNSSHVRISYAVFCLKKK